MINELIKQVTITRDKFKGDYKRLKADRNKKLDDAEMRFINDALKDKKAEINQEFNDAVDKCRGEAFSYIIPLIEAEKQTEKAKLTKCDTDKLNRLLTISKLPISQLECELLIDEFSGDYFRDKALLNIATTNRLDIHSEKFLKLQKNIDERMSILDGLENDCKALFETYSASDRYNEEIILSDKDLFDAELSYHNGFIGENVDSETKARVILGTIGQEKTAVGQALTFKSTFNNSDKETKSHLLSMMKEHRYLKEQVFEMPDIQELMSQGESEQASEE